MNVMCKFTLKNLKIESKTKLAQHFATMNVAQLKHIHVYRMHDASLA